MFTPLTAAAISFEPVKYDLQANAEKLEQMFRRAAALGAQLALGPEGALEGYVVNDLVEGKVPPSRMHQVAVSLDGPEIDRFRRLARQLKICLAFGLAEKIGKDVYNCAVFIDHTGKICGKYHKMQLAEGYHSSWWYNRLGRQSRAFNTPVGRVGFLICNDRWNADLARIPVLDGARLLLVPSYGSCHPTQDKAVLARARENGVAILEANVGVTLAISQGEIIARSRRKNVITLAELAIPAAPSKANRDRQELNFLSWRQGEMRRRYLQLKEKLKA
jgi:predicted amidohydrolase